MRVYVYVFLFSIFMVTLTKQQWLDSYIWKYKLQSNGAVRFILGGGCASAGAGGSQRGWCWMGPAILREPLRPGSRPHLQ